MTIRESHIMGGSHLVILGAGASIASSYRNPEANGRKLPSMNDLPKVVDMSDILSQLPEEILCDNFEELYGNIYEWDADSKFLEEINNKIYRYFAALKLPMEPTIYDYLVMSLRDKDVIATFNWDPFLFQAWWRNYMHGSSPGLLFLHGNVGIGYNEEIEGIGWAGTIGKRTHKYFEPTKLMYPVKHKNYTDDVFIKEQWKLFEKCLQDSKRVTVFGYSAPKSDVEAISAMQKAWGTPEQRNLEQFELIDIREENEVKASWDGFIHSHHYDYCTDFFQSSLALYPRRAFEAYMMQCFPCTPEEAFVEAVPIPQTETHTFDEMWEWYEPLIKQEEEDRERYMNSK